MGVPGFARMLEDGMGESRAFCNRSVVFFSHLLSFHLPILPVVGSGLLHTARWVMLNGRAEGCPGLERRAWMEEGAWAPSLGGFYPLGDSISWAELQHLGRPGHWACPFCFSSWLGLNWLGLSQKSQFPKAVPGLESRPPLKNTVPWAKPFHGGNFVRAASWDSFTMDDQSPLPVPSLVPTRWCWTHPVPPSW